MEVIDSEMDPDLKQHALQTMGFDTKSYDWLNNEYGEARMRFKLYQEIIAFTYAIDLLS